MVDHIFMSSADFRHWLITSEPRNHATYYIGYLATDRECQPELNVLANMAWEAQAGGFVELTQRRLGAGIYAYRATRTEELVG